MRAIDCVIIGGGSAAISCAISARKYGVDSICIIERDAYLGGILNQCIHNGFGLQIFKKECTGPQFAELLSNELNNNIEVMLETTVVSVSEDKKITIINKNKGVETIQAKSIVLASGCMERNRGAISIPGDRCGGVFTAGTAQRFLNIDGYLCGKKVFILGSGDIGLIMARRMTLEGAKVLGVAEIQPYSNGLSRNIVQCLEDFDIPLYLSTTVTNIIGKNRIEKIELSQVDERLKPIPGTQWEVECDCLLLSVGLLPEVTLLSKLPIERDPRTRSVKVNECFETTLPGFFACGNALQVHDLVDFVSMEGNNVGKQVARYLNGEIDENAERKPVLPGNQIGYVVPQYIRTDNIDSDCKFSFRVRKPMKKVTLRVIKDGICIKEIKKRIVLPAEMETLNLEKKDLAGIKESLVLEMREEHEL